MTKIRATCPTCGNVEFGVHSIVVLGTTTAAGGPSAAYLTSGPRGGSATYRFECPSCDRPVLRHAEREIIELLLSVGVPVEAPRVALESVRSEAANLPAFTLSDVDRLREAMASPDWFARLHESGL
jgi:hypothetical protein